MTAMTGPAGQFAGWIAIYKGQHLTIRKEDAKGIWAAKEQAFVHFKVPKSKRGLLAIAPAYEDD